MHQVVDTRYRTTELLGIGGMAEVYLAHDEVLDRDVALKVLSRRFAEDDEVIERFRGEARSAAALRHPNIVSIYDRGETEDGTYYIVMEYLPGGTLKDWILREGRLPPHAAAALAVQVAEALREAHRNGVIHRDVKPQNTLLTESGDVKVADFGIARAASSATLTRTGVVLGSVHYMSPEQAIGACIDSRSDLYSLGIVLYEMLTGELPYDGENPISVAMKHLEGRPPSPREIDPSIPEGIDAVTVRLLAKDPEERYPDGASLLEDLERIQKGSTPTAATMRLAVGTTSPPAADAQPTAPREARIGGTPSPPAPRRRNKRRWRIVPLVVAATLLVGLALIGTVGASFWQAPQERSEVPVVEASSLVGVPDVAGQSIAEASRTLRDAGLTVDREQEAVKSDEPEGTVLGTDPPAGSEVEEGTSVTLTVSRGAPQERLVAFDTPTDSGAALKVATAEPTTQQLDPAPPVPTPTPTTRSVAPRQSDSEQSAEEREEEVLEDQKETQEEAREVAREEEGQVQVESREEGGEIRERVNESIEEIQENVQGRLEKAREDREDD